LHAPTTTANAPPARSTTPPWSASRDAASTSCTPCSATAPSTRHARRQPLDETIGTPPALGEVLRDQLVTVTEASTQLLTSRGMLALAVALGTATTAAAFLIDALTLAYREAETRPLLHRTGLALPSSPAGRWSSAR